MLLPRLISRCRLPLSLMLLLLLGLTVAPSQEAKADQRPFHMNVFFGMSAAGQLFRAEDPNPDYFWRSPEGESFKAESVRADLDENVMFGARFGKGISQQFSINVSAAFTTMNVTAVALTEARNLDTYNWDSLNANFVDAVLVWDWTSQSTTPYLLAGAGYASLSFVEREDSQFSLDQSGVQYILGGGFRWELLQFEVRDHIVPIDLEPERLRLLEPPVFEGKNPLHLWEITLAFTLNFGKAES